MIPNCELSVQPAEFDQAEFGDLIAEFLSTSPSPQAGARAPQFGGFQTIVFTDIESSTATTQRVGDSAVRAVEASLAIQRQLADTELRVRIGINAGEPIAEDGDFFGTVVQLAARICERAEPGQVLLSRVVADLCAGKGLDIAHHADATLRGFPESSALYEAVSG